MRLSTPYGMLFFGRFGLSWVMPHRVVDLFACWWTLLECCKKQNNRNSEDQERTLEELKTFYSLFTWTIAYLSPLVISFNDFLILFSSPN